MRFAVDAHAIGRHQTGNEVYIRSLIKEFAAQARGCEWVAYISTDSAKAAIPANIQTRLVSANPFRRLGVDLAQRLREDRPDLLHVQYTAPVGCAIPIVVSVHDVSFLEHPEYFTPDRALQLRWTVRRTVRRAVRVLTGCEFSKQAILRAYPDLDEGKVVVAPYAAAPEFRSLPREAAQAAVMQRFSLSGPFVLNVGDLHPRKNQIGLIRAFAQLVKAHPQIKHTLALAGKDTWFAGKVRDAARESGVMDRIRFLGFVTDDDLLRLYNACDLFVFPSFYEGFGLPALEAMACGRAVVCSSASALPEVVDGAAILTDPAAEEEMVRAMADVLLDAELRTRMERLGLRRAAHFNWHDTARRTLAVFRDVAERAVAAVETVASPSMARR
ncbi:MAG TPA: glycosyltransferase family 1 protein [Bryobacteraceae bacterium]|nr:glycosyltransferase family 1 protein [Bryobacteraceae bacterium]